jgi:hypothetical protein
MCPESKTVPYKIFRVLISKVCCDHLPHPNCSVIHSPPHYYYVSASSGFGRYFSMRRIYRKPVPLKARQAERDEKISIARSLNPRFGEAKDKLALAELSRLAAEATVPVTTLPPEPIPAKLPGSRWMSKGLARVVKPPAQGLTKVTPKPILADTGEKPPWEE